MIFREKIIKREGEVGRARQQMHGEIMIQDQRAKVVVTWAVVGKVKSGFIDTWLGDKNKGDNYVVIPCGALCHDSKNLAFCEMLKMAELVH